MTTQNHYELLGITRFATPHEIKTAYEKVIADNHPDKSCRLGLFGRAKANVLTKKANQAWNVLSYPPEKLAYDRSLPTPSAGGASTSRANVNPGQQQPASDEASPESADTKDEGDAEDAGAKEGEYRHMATSTGTVVDVKISSWRLYLHLSSKYRFLSDITELLPLRHDAKAVSFEMGLERDNEDSEALLQTINELTLRVTDAPKQMVIVKIETFLKESDSGAMSLQVAIHAERSKMSVQRLPFKFGFDVDMNHRATSLNCGTLMIFHRCRWNDFAVEDRIKKEEGLKATELVDLGLERFLPIVYGDVKMWRAVAVGYR